MLVQKKEVQMFIKKIAFLLIVMSNIILSLASSEPTPEQRKKFITDRDHLYKVLAREEKITKEMESSPFGPQLVSKYEQYLRKLDDCRKKKGETFHVNNDDCLDCKAAFNQADKSTQYYINQKEFENEVGNALACTLDCQNYYTQ
jgi:hypothetical protein